MMTVDRRNLENFPWYHGSIRRKEAEARLHVPGQFLVRDCITSPGDFVLTCFWQNRAMNFMINRVKKISSEDHAFQFEEEQFDTVPDLINFHITHQKPVTELSMAILSIPVTRPDFKNTDSKIALDNKENEDAGMSVAKPPQDDNPIDPGFDDGPVAYEDTSHHPTMVGGRLSRHAYRSLLKSTCNNGTPSVGSSLPNIFVPRDVPVLHRPLPAIPERGVPGSLSMFDLSPPPLPPRNPPKPKRAPSLKSRDRPTVFVRRDGILAEVTQEDLQDDYCEIDYAELDDELSNRSSITSNGSNFRAGQFQDYDVLSSSEFSNSARSSRGSAYLMSSLRNSASFYDRLEPRSYDTLTPSTNSLYDKLSSGSPVSKVIIRRTRSEQDGLDRDSACVMDYPPVVCSPKIMNSGSGLSTVPSLMCTDDGNFTDGGVGSSFSSPLTEEEDEGTLKRNAKNTSRNNNNMMRNGDLPVISARKIKLDGYSGGSWFNGTDNKPLAGSLVEQVRKTLLNEPPESVAAHMTKATWDFLLDQEPPVTAALPTRLREKLQAGLFVAFQPWSDGLRDEIVERHKSLKCFITITILHSTSIDECASMLARWTGVARALRDDWSNGFDLGSVLGALCGDWINSAHAVQSTLKRVNPPAYQALHQELRPLLIRMELGQQWAGLFGRGAKGLLALPPVQFILSASQQKGDMGLTLVEDGEGNLDSFWRFLQRSRVSLSLASQMREHFQWLLTDQLADKLTTVDEHNRSVDLLNEDRNNNNDVTKKQKELEDPEELLYDFIESTTRRRNNYRDGKKQTVGTKGGTNANLLELFRTEFQLRFMLGSTGVLLTPGKRDSQVEKILSVLSEQWR